MARSRILALALGAVGLLACNAIIGLSDFEKRECAGKDPCPFDGGADVDNDTFRPDGGADAKADAPPGASPVSWAEFEMPNHKKDAGILVFDPRPLDYTVVDENQVTDNVTKLVWQRKVIGTGVFGDDHTEEEAIAQCAMLPGPDKWRVPKRIELVTLLSHGLGAPFIDRDVFSVKSVKVWTSSEVRTAAGITPGTYWTVDFEIGAVGQRASGDGAKVLCVKGTP